MMGHQSRTESLFYYFRLEEQIPTDHLLRIIDGHVDFSFVREQLKDFYSPTGRPSIDPEVLLRLLLIGYLYGITSDRRLMDEVRMHLAYRWFTRLGFDQEIPDHSTFSKNRHGRFRDSDTFRHVFESVLRRCMTEGLVGGEGFAIDASVVRADANRARGVPGTHTMDWKSGTLTTRAVREYVAALEAANPTETQPKSVSLTDPAARYTAAPGGPAFYAYSTNYLVDVDVGIIVDVEATPAYRSDEVDATKTMIDRVEERFDIKPDRLVGDTAYGTAEMLGWMVNEKAIEPHVPVWDKTQRTDETLSSSDFQWNELADEYRCPQGHELRKQRREFRNPRSHVTKADTIIYRASQSDCATCPMKARCCPNTPRRKIARSLYESARDVARAIAKTNEYKQSRKDRKKVEMLFAHLKRIMKLDRLRLRGLSGAKDEFLMAATVQNLRRMAKWLAPDTQNGGLVPA